MCSEACIALSIQLSDDITMNDIVIRMLEASCRFCIHFLEAAPDGVLMAQRNYMDHFLNCIRVFDKMEEYYDALEWVAKFRDVLSKLQHSQQLSQLFEAAIEAIVPNLDALASGKLRPETFQPRRGSSRMRQVRPQRSTGFGKSGLIALGAIAVVILGIGLASWTQGKNDKAD
jgi:hypothetical protein